MLYTLLSIEITVSSNTVCWWRRDSTCPREWWEFQCGNTAQRKRVREWLIWTTILLTESEFSWRNYFLSNILQLNGYEPLKKDILSFFLHHKHFSLVKGSIIKTTEANSMLRHLSKFVNIPWCFNILLPDIFYLFLKWGDLTRA